jgi:hypothetical protein
MQPTPETFAMLADDLRRLAAWFRSPEVVAALDGRLPADLPLALVVEACRWCEARVSAGQTRVAA